MTKPKPKYGHDKELWEYAESIEDILPPKSMRCEACQVDAMHYIMVNDRRLCEKCHKDRCDGDCPHETHILKG